MHEIRVRNDYMGVLAEGPVSSISTDSRFGTLVGTTYRPGRQALSPLRLGNL